MTYARALQVLLLIFFALVLCAAVSGIFWSDKASTPFVTVMIFMTGGIVLIAMSDTLQSFSIGPKGIVAELKRTIEAQQELINFFVRYSVAEIIYWELLWKITNKIEVQFDQTAAQIRWLTFLYDHGLIQANDTKNWLEIGQIPRGQNLSSLFRLTPAAEKLIQLRGQPS